MRSLGLDIGDKRIGVAVSDPTGMLARPLLVLEREEDSTAVAAILKLVEEYDVRVIIAGLPRSMDGSLGSQAEKVRQFVEKLPAVSGVPVEYRDERLTTEAAKDLLKARGRKKVRFVEKGAYDAAAAAVILQTYLNETSPLSYPVVDHD